MGAHAEGPPGFGIRNLLVILGISLSSLAYGYGAAVIATIGGTPSFLEYFDLITAPDASARLGASVCAYYIGGVFGSSYGAWAADRWGRRNSQIQANVILAIAGALQAGSVHIAMFIVGRILCGFAGYMQIVGIPIWMAELVPSRQRGMLMDLHAVALIVGYFSAQWIGYGFYFYHGSVLSFRPVLAFQCLPPVLFLAIAWLIPESPRYLVMKNKHQQARDVLKTLHSSPGDTDFVFAETEYLQISRQIELDKTLDKSVIKLWKSGWPMRKRILFAVVWPFITTASGILVVANYGPLLYSSLGYDSATQLMYNGLWMTIELVSNIMAPFIVDRFPRPGYVAVGLFGCFITLVGEAVVIKDYAEPGTGNTAALKAGVAMLFLYAFFYGVVVDGMLFIWLAEVFPTPLRAIGFQIGLTGHALFNIIWLAVAPTAFANVGWRYLLPFIIITGLSVFLVYFYFPNTRHLPLEEVGALFGDKDMVAVYQRDIVFDSQTHEFKVKDEKVDQNVEHHEEIREVV